MPEDAALLPPAAPPEATQTPPPYNAVARNAVISVTGTTLACLLFDHPETPNLRGLVLQKKRLWVPDDEPDIIGAILKNWYPTKPLATWTTTTTGAAQATDPAQTQAPTSPPTPNAPPEFGTAPIGAQNPTGHVEFNVEARGTETGRCHYAASLTIQEQWRTSRARLYEIINDIGAANRQDLYDEIEEHVLNHVEEVDRETSDEETSDYNHGNDEIEDRVYENLTEVIDAFLAEHPEIDPDLVNAEAETPPAPQALNGPWADEHLDGVTDENEDEENEDEEDDDEDDGEPDDELLPRLDIGFQPVAAEAPVINEPYGILSVVGGVPGIFPISPWPPAGLAFTNHAEQAAAMQEEAARTLGVPNAIINPPETETREDV